MNAKKKSIDTNLILGKPGTHPGGVDSAKDLLDMMDRYDVEQGFVSHIASSIHDADVGNRLLFEALEECHAAIGRLHGVPVVRLRRLPADSTWREWRSRRVRCVRLCPAFYKEQAPDGDLVSKLRESLTEYGFALQMSLVPFYGSSWVSASMSDAFRFAEAVAPAPFLLSGIGRGNFADVEALLASQPSAVVDVGNLTTGTGTEDLVAAGYGDRLVCGSGYGISYPRQFFDVIGASRLPDEAIRKIVYGNARLLADGSRSA
jgi:hypothetical protein